MEKQKLRCAHCGASEHREVVFGYPSADLVERSERGEIVLGGCTVGEEARDWLCDDCRHEPEEAHRRSTADSAVADSDSRR